MTILRTAQIAQMTGLPRSTLARHLQSFPDARAGHGRYDSSCPAFGAWLELHMPANPGGTPAAPLPTARREPVLLLPSGLLLVGWDDWDSLRGSDDDAARKTLARIIELWRLRPHPAVPDVLPFEPMPVGRFTLNRRQWLTLRHGSEVQAAAALDVLLRRWEPSS